MKTKLRDRLIVYGATLTSVIGITFGDLYTQTLCWMAFLVCLIFLISEDIEDANSGGKKE